MSRTTYALVAAAAVLVALNPGKEGFQRWRKDEAKREYEASLGTTAAEVVAELSRGVNLGGEKITSYGVCSVALLPTGEAYLGVADCWFEVPPAVAPYLTEDLPLPPALKGRFAPFDVVAGAAIVSLAVLGLLNSENFAHFAERRFVAGSRIFYNKSLYTIFTAAFYHHSSGHLFSDMLSLGLSALRTAEMLRMSGPNFLRLAIAAVATANLVGSATQLLGQRYTRYGSYASGLFPVSLAMMAFMATKRPNADLVWFGLKLKPAQALLGQICMEIFLLRGTLLPHLPASLGSALTGYLFYFYLRYGLQRMLPRAWDDVVRRYDNGLWG